MVPLLPPRPVRRPLLPLALLALSLSGCLSMCGRDAGEVPTPAARRVVLLPMGEGAQGSVEAVRAGLEQTYPGLPVTVAPPEPLPQGVEGREGQVSAEKLMHALEGRGPGLLVLLEADVGSQVFSSVFSQVDFAHGNAVVSLPRFRTADGSLPARGATPSAEALARAQMRTRKQAINTVGKLLALFPCTEEECLLQRPRGVKELDKAEGLCPRHGALLEQVLAALHGSPDGGH